MDMINRTPRTVIRMNTRMDPSMPPRTGRSMSGVDGAATTGMAADNPSDGPCVASTVTPLGYNWGTGTGQLSAQVDAMVAAGPAVRHYEAAIQPAFVSDSTNASG